MISVDDVLKPIPGDKPCGEDYSYHPSFQQMQELAKPKLPGEFNKDAAVEEPDWKAVRDAAMDVLSHSKHLDAGIYLTTALLKLGGVEGFRDGLAVERGLLEQYWNDVYPKLDPEDNNDPTQRLNILSNLSSGKFIVHLKQVVLCNSIGMGRITLENVLNAKDRGDKPAPPRTPGSPSPGPDLNQIQAAFRDAGPPAATATLALINECIGHAQGTDKFLDATLGAGKGVNFEALHKMLQEMKRTVEPYATNGAPTEAAAGEASEASAGNAKGLATRVESGISGSVQTRAHVLKALDLVCAYYSTNEPSSPIPLILQRAQRLVDKDFMAIMTDLNPDALAKLHVITGTKPEK